MPLTDEQKYADFATLTFVHGHIALGYHIYQI